jgi:molecular chaperone GrpE
MISRQIEEMLKKYGVVEIESLNREFDPALNEAVEIEEGDGVDKDTITKVYQKGFMIDDYIVRCARVRVTRRVHPSEEPRGSGGGREDQEN